MFSFGYLLLAAAAIVTVVAGPITQSPPRVLNLDEMINKTVCAIKTKINYDPNRIPQRIKMMKCAKQTDQWCKQNGLQEGECCSHTSNQHVMECVEMIDKVMVYYKDSNKTDTLHVSVGCACVIGRSTVAPSLSEYLNG